jgi:O-antigen/teichoic acid export membrane protein
VREPPSWCNQKEATGITTTASKSTRAGRSPLTVEVAEASLPQGTAMARNAFYLLLGQVASTVLSIVLSAALGRTLGAEDFGRYFLLVTMSTFAFVFVDWGQSAYLVREAARNPAATEVLLGSALVFRTAAAAGAAVVTALVTRLLGYDGRTQALSALMVVCSLPLALSQPYSYLFRGRDRMDLDAAVTIAAKAVTVALTVPALFLGGRLVAVIMATGAGGIGAFAVATALARRLRLARPHAAWPTVRDIASGGAPIAAFFIAIAVQPYIDVIVLSRLAPASSVGWYGAARNIVGVLMAPATIVAAAAFPQLSRAASRPDELGPAVRAALRPLLGLGALASVGTFLFADLAVSLIYGRDKFGPAATVLTFFSPTLLLFFVDMLLGNVVTALGRTRELALAKFVNVMISTTLAVFLVPLFQARVGNGGLGLVLAFGTSEVVMLAAFLAVVPRGTLDRGTLLDVGRAILAAVGTLALFRLLPFPSPWLGLPVSVGAFAALSWAVGLVDSADVSTVLRS